MERKHEADASSIFARRSEKQRLVRMLLRLAKQEANARKTPHADRLSPFSLPQVQQRNESAYGVLLAAPRGSSWRVSGRSTRYATKIESLAQGTNGGTMAHRLPPGPGTR